MISRLLRPGVGHECERHLPQSLPLFRVSRRIRDGQLRRDSPVEIARLLFVAQKISPEERDRVRQGLLNYCERDTWAMVKVLERLRELAGSGR